MPRLQELLEEAARGPVAFDVGADLRRARRARARRRTSWAAGLTGCLVTAGAGTYAVTAGHGTTEALQPADPGSSDTVTPSADPGMVHLKFYDVPQPPAGWHVVGERPQYVMISKDGSGVTSVDSGFVGQVVILYDPDESGYDFITKQPTIEYDGRTFYSTAGEGDPSSGPADMETVSVRAADGNWLRVQYPQADFSADAMVAYLDGVVIKDGAQTSARSTHYSFKEVTINGQRVIVPGGTTLKGLQRSR